MLTGYRRHCLLTVLLLAAGMVVGVNACEEEGGNRPPKIVSGISVPTGTVRAGERIQLRVISATDPDGDALTYTWEALKGRVEPSGPSADPVTIYTAPLVAQQDSVTVTVSDGKGGTSTDTIGFTVVVAVGTPSPSPVGPRPSPTGTPSPGTATPTVPASVEITEPADGGTVEHKTQVGGTVADLALGRDIWVFVQPHLAPQFHPQPKAITNREKGEWWATAYFGTSPSTNIGEQFEVIVTVADRGGSQAIEDYLRQAEQTGSWPGLAFLPDGVEMYDQITVTRG